MKSLNEVVIWETYTSLRKALTSGLKTLVTVCITNTTTFVVQLNYFQLFL
jgi:hypothetical protein